MRFEIVEGQLDWFACFQAANKDGRYKDLLSKADKFVRGLQYGADGAKDYVISGDGATIVITTADEDIATAAISALP